MRLSISATVGLLISFVFQVHSAVAIAQENNGSDWRCSNQVNYRQPVSIQLTEPSDSEEFGAVSVDNSAEMEAQLSIQGFEKRWDFGENMNNFAIIIRHNGSALYYDFRAIEVGDLAYGHQIFSCVSQ